MENLYYYIAIGIGILLSLFGFGSYQRKVGRNQERDKRTKENLEVVNESKKTEHKVTGLPDDDLLSEFDRLYNK